METPGDQRRNGRAVRLGEHQPPPLAGRPPADLVQGMAVGVRLAGHRIDPFQSSCEQVWGAGVGGSGEEGSVRVGATLGVGHFGVTSGVGYVGWGLGALVASGYEARFRRVSTARGASPETRGETGDRNA